MLFGSSRWPGWDMEERVSDMVVRLVPITTLVKSEDW